NTGTLSAPAGTVGLGAGQNILLMQAGDPHILVQPGGAGNVGGTGVNNKGTISAVQAELKANGGNIYAMAINQAGTVQATGAVNVGGKIYLTGGNGSVTNSGTLTATRRATGGYVEITGKNIHLTSTSSINASGPAAGGQVYVGGSSQGKGPLPNAATTT